MSLLLVDAGADQHDFDMRGPGNGVVRFPLATQRLRDARKRRVLCIHGCNTGDQKGLKTTANFRRWLIERCRGLQGQVFNITWPGDVSWSSGGLFRYKTMKERADLAGERLWNSLEHEYDKGEGAETLVIVAHSLGCRLALQAVAAMVDHKGREFPNQRSGRCYFPSEIVLILMGAAVPVDLGKPLSKAVEHANIVILHSDCDVALKLAFPMGQWWAGEGKREAVGLHGRPLSPPNPRVGPMPRYNHEHYWLRPFTADVVAEQLRKYFPDLLSEVGLHREGNIGETNLLPKTPKLEGYVLGEAWS